MSLSGRDQQALDVIAQQIAGSDPGLASKMATFTRLTADEEMPLREKILAARKRDDRHLLRLHRHPEFRRTALLLWLVVVVGLVAVAVAIGSGSKSVCTKARAAACAGPVPTLRSTAHQTAADSVMLGTS